MSNNNWRWTLSTRSSCTHSRRKIVKWADEKDRNNFRSIPTNKINSSEITWRILCTSRIIKNCHRLNSKHLYLNDGISSFHYIVFTKHKRRIYFTIQWIHILTAYNKSNVVLIYNTIRKLHKEQKKWCKIFSD